MPSSLSLYITVPSREIAEKIARALVEEKLAACINIFAGVRSIYRWKGKVETANEVCLVAKSRAELFDKLEKRVKELHPYECPCIVAFPIGMGHQPYLDWIAEETT